MSADDPVRPDSFDPETVRRLKRVAPPVAAVALALLALVYYGVQRSSDARADAAARAAVEAAEAAYADGADFAALVAMSEALPEALARHEARLSPEGLAEYSARADLLRVVVGIYVAARSDILDEQRSARVAAAFAKERLDTLEADAEGLFDHRPLESALIGLVAERMKSEADRVAGSGGRAEALAGFEDLRLLAFEWPPAFAEVRRREIEYLELARANLTEADALAGMPEVIAVPARAAMLEARARDEAESIVIQADRVLATALADMPVAIERLEELLEAAEALGAGEPVEALLGECRRLQTYVEETLEKARGGDAVAGMVLLTLRAAGASDRAAARLAWIDRSADSASIKLEIDGYGATVSMRKDADSFEIASRGFRFAIPSRVSVRRALYRAADVARRMQEAGVPVALAEEWRLIEGPGFAVPYIAGEGGGAAMERAFIGAEVVRPVVMDEEWRPRLTAYLDAARALITAIRSDAELEPELRQLAAPMIESSIGEIDSRDFLRPAFCRKALEEGYLERYLPKVYSRHAELVDGFRRASLALGRRTPVFRLVTADAAYTALRAPETLDAKDESLSDYAWTVVRADGSSSFFAEMNPLSPYSVRLVAEYDAGADEPSTCSVYHQSGGRLASSVGPDFDSERWLAAMKLDHSGDASLLFPPHVCEFDPEGGVSAIITPSGAIERPAFEAIGDEAERNAAIDVFVSKCAAVLGSPGELGLVQQHFFEYVLDSPMASRPDLVGNHAAYGDVHQTVHQFLGREVAGLFLGDCDNVAEFFQRVTREQGRLSHILSLPSHAACAFAMQFPEEDEPWGLVVLQTGPVMLFRGYTLEEAVEACYEHFSRGDDQGFSAASVPFLFRFAGEDTNTTYWLSSRILVDEEYAELLIRVQGYWHYHYYATAIEAMEARLETDRYLSNFMELAGLYGTVGLHRESKEMTAMGLAGMHRDDDRVRLREMLDIARGHHQLGEDDMAEALLSDIIAFCQDLLRQRRFEEFGRLGGTRLGAAELYLAMDLPYEAFGAIRYDLRMMRNPNGRLTDRLLHALIRMVGDLAKSEDEEAAKLKDGIRKFLEDEFASRVFFEEDDFGDLMRNYSAMAAYAEATEGFDAVFDKLTSFGLYPERKQAHHGRGLRVTDEDWRWIRIVPFSYSRLMAKTLDPEDERYAPERAAVLIDAMLSGAEAGRGQGSMNHAEGALHSARVVLAMLNRDINLFSQVLDEVAALGADRSVGSVADEFGRRAGLIPLDEFDRWAEAFLERVSDRQHYFSVAHHALRAKHYERGLRMGRLAAERFPEERMMAVEADYMAELVERLKARETEVERERERLKAWKAAQKLAERGDAAAALEAVVKAEELGSGRPALVTSLLTRAERLFLEGQASDAVSAAERAARVWREMSLDSSTVFARLQNLAGAFEKRGDGNSAEKLKRLLKTLLEAESGGGQSRLDDRAPAAWRKSA